MHLPSTSCGQAMRHMLTPSALAATTGDVPCDNPREHTVSHGVGPTCLQTESGMTNWGALSEGHRGYKV